MKYASNSSLDRTRVVTENGWIVRRIAVQVVSHCPANVEYDDMVQVGTLGLLDAAERYDPSRDAKFATFAQQRVLGAMLDELRSTDPIPRGARQQASAVEAAVQRVQHSLGRKPRDLEVAEELDMPLYDFQKLSSELYKLQELSFSELKSFDGLEFDEYIERVSGVAPSPLELLEQREMYEQIVSMFDILPEREREVISCLYEKGMTIREVAQKMKVSDSRVCQLRTSASKRIAKALMADRERETSN